MKKHIILGLFAVLFAACGDPCKDVVCHNGGVCDDGTCHCPVGAEGADCSVETRMRYAGSYAGTYIEDADTFAMTSILVGADSAAPITQMDVWLMRVDLTSETTFSIPNQAITGPYARTIQSGSGTCDGESLSYQVAYEISGANHTARFSGSRQ